MTKNSRRSECGVGAELKRARGVAIGRPSIQRGGKSARGKRAILVGGSGPQKTLRIVARHADLWNAYGSPTSLAASDTILRERCDEVGRDHEQIERTVNLNVVVRSTRGEAERVWASYAAAHRPREGEGRLVVGGPVDEVAATLADYGAIGFRHPILIFRSPWDLETIGALGALREAVASAT